MTEFQYKEAMSIKAQIASIDDLLMILKNVDDYQLNPPTRQSGFSLLKMYGEDKTQRALSECEALCIKNALESQKAILERNFEKL